MRELTQGTVAQNQKGRFFSKTANPGKLRPWAAAAELSYAENPTLLQLKTWGGSPSAASSVSLSVGGPRILVKTDNYLQMKTVKNGSFGCTGLDP